MKNLVATAALLLAAASGHAQIVAGGNVDGLGTFEDQNTGRTWLRLDDFFGMSGDQMVSTAQGAGFQLASSEDVSVLLAGLTPITHAKWLSDAAIMGSAPNRNIIWGAYEGSDSVHVGWAWAADWDSSWSMIANADSIFDTPNGVGSPYADMNIWAFRNPDQDGPGDAGPRGAVPEPVSWALMLAGFGLVGAKMRRGRIAVSFRSPTL
jgi:hypothetical protein